MYTISNSVKLRIEIDFSGLKRYTVIIMIYYLSHNYRSLLKICIKYDNIHIQINQIIPISASYTFSCQRVSVSVISIFIF